MPSHRHIKRLLAELGSRETVQFLVSLVIGEDHYGGLTFTYVTFMPMHAPGVNVATAACMWCGLLCRTLLSHTSSTVGTCETTTHIYICPRPLSPIFSMTCNKGIKHRPIKPGSRSQHCVTHKYNPSHLTPRPAPPPPPPPPLSLCIHSPPSSRSCTGLRSWTPLQASVRIRKPACATAAQTCPQSWPACASWCWMAVGGGLR